MKQYAIFALTLAVLISGCVEEKTEKNETWLNESETQKTQEEQQQIQILPGEILKIAEQRDEVKQFITENPGYDYEIITLTPENITKLAEEYPVIYEGLPSKTLYKVDYRSDGRGALAIIDVENKEVLKYFRTTGINI